jgi:DNA-binding SARP family transcriptional activator
VLCRLLGPVEVRAGGSWTGVSAPKWRALLAVLALRPGQVVSTGQLAGELWGDDPPAGVRKLISGYVAALRRLAGDPDGRVLVTQAPGYRPMLAPADLDVFRFEELVAAGRAALEQADSVRAAEFLAAALALWRGPALAGMPRGPLIAAEAARLDELQVDALELRAEAGICCGRAPELVAELRQLTAGHPLRERFWQQLMRALEQAGRPAQALEAYAQARKVLAEELGADPGPDLQRLHRHLLAGGPAAAASPAAGPQAVAALAPAVLRQLPATVPQFAGRASELAGLTGLLDRAELPGTVVISAIDGMPGVGKTALAVQAGHLVADRFPDRQLFADLHGHTPGRQPADPADVLAALLAADGVDPRYLPADLDARAAMWRDRMAGQRALLILDNAASSAQVAPLLPGTSGCLVLITSRRFLGDLPAAAEVPLDVLPPGDAATMFEGLAPRALGEPAAVAELVALCGHLPLAISLLARLFTRHRSWTMADLIAETRAGLLTVTVESRTVAAAFEVSYRHLDADRQRFFRRLGLYPGAHTDAYAAAALAGLPLAQAAGHLAGLLGDRLLEEPVPGRYKMHDLIRVYARSLAEAEDAGLRKQALDQLLEYYQSAARAAGTHVARHGLPTSAQSSPPATMPDLSGWDAARAWMTAERPNLVACIEDAAVRRDHARQVGLTAATAAHLRIDGPWPQGMSLHATAAAAARHIGDQLGQADALLNLGDLRRLAGDYPGATEALEQARGIYADTGGRPGEAGALLCLGEVRRSTGDFPAAAGLLEQAQGIYSDIGGRLGEAAALLVLGTVWQVTGDYPAAVDALERSLQISRRAGNRPGEAEALRNLGAVRNLTGDRPAANRALEQALDISAALGDLFGEANAMACLGLVRQGTGDLAGAISVLERALATFRDIGSRLGEANALCWLGDVVRDTGNLPEAARVLNQALLVYREIGNRHGTASALHNLGSVHQAAGDVSAADDLLAQARDLYHDVGDALGEAQTLNQIGTLRLECHQQQSARRHYLRALAISRSIDNQTEADSALEGILKCDTAIAIGPARR